MGIIAFLRLDPAGHLRVGSGEIVTLVDERLPHLRRVLLINAEHDGPLEALAVRAKR